MNDAEIAKKRREKAEDEAAKDLIKPLKQLLDDVHDESLVENRSDGFHVSRVLVRFSSLLASIANKNSETANKVLEITKTNEAISKRNLSFQKWLIRLTVVILVLTICQLIIAFSQLSLGNPTVPQEPQHHQQRHDTHD